MNIYFTILIGLYLLADGIILGRHGEPRDGEYNFITSSIGTVIQLVLVYFAIKTGFKG